MSAKRSSKRKRWPTREQLERALRRLRLESERALTRLHATAPRPPGMPARFTMLAMVPRGTFGVLHALDEDGQVWERHTVFDKATQRVVEEWWEAVGMERRRPLSTAPEVKTGGAA